MDDMMREASKEEVEASKRLESLLDDFKELNIDSDTAAFLFMTTGMVLMLNSNKDDPHFVSYLLSSALMSASAQAASELVVEGGETKH